MHRDGDSQALGWPALTRVGAVRVRLGGMEPVPYGGEVFGLLIESGKVKLATFRRVDDVMWTNPGGWWPRMEYRFERIS